MRKLERDGTPLSAGAWGTGLGGNEVGPGDMRDKGCSLPVHGARLACMMPGGGQPAGLRRGLPTALERNEWEAFL